MKPNAQETRETFRDYVINTRPLYEGITAPALTLAGPEPSRVRRARAYETGAVSISENITLRK